MLFTELTLLGVFERCVIMPMEKDSVCCKELVFLSKVVEGALPIFFLSLLIFDLTSFAYISLLKLHLPHQGKGKK